LLASFLVPLYEDCTGRWAREKQHRYMNTASLNLLDRWYRASGAHHAPVATNRHRTSI